MKYWTQFLQTVNSPVKNIFPIVNIALVLIIAALATVAAQTWVDPEYPGRVDVNSIAHVPKNLEPLVLSRKPRNAKIIHSAVQRNLFRKDRKEFSPPVQIARALPKSALPALPPPNLKLKGVLLLATKRIAIMEGNFPAREGGNSIQKKPLKKKGYPLGTKIGSFELTNIEKNKVTLNNNRGVILNLNLKNRSDDKIIRKVGNALIQKSKTFDPGNIKKPAPPRRTSKATLKRPKRKPKPVRAPRAFRISGAPTQNPGGTFKPHISGQ